ncbi:uncharacterized protein HD842_000222 [Massilia aurea]|uniref:TPM domain-containing protein n=1 Tax=Massilia aurea TaxID=373040 RepID=A0A7W9U5P8_9BURK|nr:TPM domain-containing protein [Massilia aurea]MBB6132111.1 uncharacterized protein [Massilia aurea]
MTPFLRFFSTLLLALATLFAGVAPAHAQLKEVPELKARVTDQVGMLDAAQRDRLEAVLADYEAKTGSQIAVLLVKSTEPEAIEAYSIRVTDAWQLGRKGVDDGVLLVVAPGNPSALRRLRIEAGRGVQGVLTDAKSKRILQDVIAPHFREQHFYEGLVAGVGAIATLLNEEAFPPPERTAEQKKSDKASEYMFYGMLGSLAAGLVLMIIVGITITRLRYKASGNSPGEFIVGAIIGGILSGGGRSSRGSSGGGGGFSGGGGSFDGGGASGDW